MKDDLSYLWSHFILSSVFFFDPQVRISSGCMHQHYIFAIYKAWDGGKSQGTPEHCFPSLPKTLFSSPELNARRWS